MTEIELKVLFWCIMGFCWGVGLMSAWLQDRDQRDLEDFWRRKPRS